MAPQPLRERIDTRPQGAQLHVLVVVDDVSLATPILLPSRASNTSVTRIGPMQRRYSIPAGSLNGGDTTLPATHHTTPLDRGIAPHRTVHPSATCQGALPPRLPRQQGQCPRAHHSCTCAAKRWKWASSPSALRTEWRAPNDGHLVAWYRQCVCGEIWAKHEETRELP